ncbi:uncharacterized protein LOC134213065 [Armigeres subalbatus]|uniref:uncharacterized protein LOC134213065 n=1 Tax=Armigeres subalbatus TaxID=124917 RepID=UPI002ED03AB2
MHKMREAKEPAIATGGEEPSSDSAGEILAQSTIEFEAVGPSSTQRPRDITGFEESKFMCSINQLSVSSIAVPECKSTTENGEIDRHTFVQWHDLLVDSMQLAGITDEATKFTIFKVKAGPRLLDIYRNSKADEGAPDAVMAPFGHAMYRLKAYYGSGSDIMLQRRRLAMMEQKSDESDLAFVTRVGSAARLCDFGKEKEFEEIVGTIAEHAHRKEVRTMAMKLLSRKGTFTDLVDKIREIEAIRLNEQFFSRKHGPKNEAVVAPVRADFPMRGGRNRYRGRGTSHRGHRGNLGGMNRPEYQGPSRGTSWGTTVGPQRNLSQSNRCWRCNSVYHAPDKCHAINKDCRNCGRYGHIQVACPSQPRIHPSKPVHETAESFRKTVALVENPEETPELKEVSDNFKKSSND